MIKLGTFNASLIPREPGVYIFKDEKDQILYVGKAKDLRSRVSNYFSKSSHPIKTVQLVSKVRFIDWIVLNNEVEAFLLENKLIKQHSPKYNIMLKDSKTYAYIAITKEKFPRVLTTRRPSSKQESFGPYTDGFMRQDLQRLVQRVFKIRTCKTFPKRACLNYHIGLCNAPCVGNVSREQYADQVEDARSFLRGNYKETIASLKEQMRADSNNHRFEHALELRNQIASIELLNRRQIVDSQKRFDQDVMVFRKDGDKLSVVQMGVRKGVLLGKKDFAVDMQPQVEQEFLKAFYSSNQIPREIILNEPCWEDESERHALEEMLSVKRNGPVSLAVPVKGEKLELVRLAEKNFASPEGTALEDLRSSLNLPAMPHIIECFDVSNLGTEHMVSGMVRFVDGKPSKSSYRKFKLSADGQDDFAGINEVVHRRYSRLSKEKAQLPDLIMVDGGAGQVSAASSALNELGLRIPLIGLAKENEEIYVTGESEPKIFPKGGRMMLLRRQIRDETHRFSIGYNIKRRQMKMRGEFSEK
jgi:excinuclease ABC subunit C